MQRIEWSKDLQIGVGFLDEQHRQIIEDLNGLIDTFNSGNADRRPSRAVALLLQHTGDHFSYEESFMLHYGFPGYEDHKRTHREFLVKAQEFVEVLRAEEGALPEWLLIMYRSWFLDHVMVDDMEYRRYFTEEFARPAQA